MNWLNRSEWQYHWQKHCRYCIFNIEKFYSVDPDHILTIEDVVFDFFEEDIFDNILVAPLAEAKEYTVKGFPVDFDNPFEADEEDEVSDLPLYTKTKVSKVFHCAGYYCIKFPKGWTSSFSPKHSTLKKYEFAGPFKTEMEMKTNLSIFKKADRN